MVQCAACDHVKADVMCMLRVWYMLVVCGGVCVCPLLFFRLIQK